MNKQFQGFVLTVILALFASVGFAAPLTDQQVKGFISTLEEFADMEENNEEFEDWLDASEQHSEDDVQLSMVDMLEQFKHHPFNRKMETVVQRHGFKNLHEWAQVGDRINAAFMHHAMGGMAELEEQFKQMQRELANAPDLTPEQKEAMLSMASGGMQMISEFGEKASPEDVETVGRHLEELQRVYDGD